MRCQAGLRDASMRRWNAAYPNALLTLAGSRVAANYLRKIALDFPEGARPHLESAAAHYDRIVALLAPATGTGPGSYESFMGDMDKQRLHAARVLVPVKTEYAAIAQELELALSAK